LFLLAALSELSVLALAEMIAKVVIINAMRFILITIENPNRFILSIATMVEIYKSDENFLHVAGGCLCGNAGLDSI